MRLIELRAENFKRLKAIRIRPKDGVTPIVGKNGAGKTSVLDAITAALGGASECPDLPIRRGATKAEVIVNLGDIKVSRRWSSRGSSLEVVAADGEKLPGPQAVLDRLLGKLSFDPLVFGRLKPAEQAATLAKIAGVDLDAHKTRRQAVFDQRTAANRAEKETRAQIVGIPPVPDDTPEEEISLAAILEELKAAEAVNAEHKRLKDQAEAAVNKHAATMRHIDLLLEEIKAIQAKIDVRKKELLEQVADVEKCNVNLEAAGKPVETEPIRQRGREAESVNKAVRFKKQRAEKEAAVQSAKTQAEELTRKIEDLDREFAESLANAKLPVPGLSIDSDAVLFNGIPFGQCSGAERLRASVAIGLALNPKLKLMLIRDGSLLDDEGMTTLAAIAEEAGAQVLIERVDNGREVGVKIEDGEVAEEAVEAAAK